VLRLGWLLRAISSIPYRQLDGSSDIPRQLRALPIWAACLDVERIDAAEIDRVFLTGGTSLVPRIRRIFTERFGDEKLESGGELTSIAHVLALIGLEDDAAAWAA